MVSRKSDLKEKSEMGLSHSKKGSKDEFGEMHRMHDQMEHHKGKDNKHAKTSKCEESCLMCAMM